MKSLPILDLSKKDSPEFLTDLRNALFDIGFLYLVNHGVEDLASQMLEQAPDLFSVPEAEKQKVAMTKNPHFVGYTQLGAEKTQKKLDLREQFDFGSAKSTDYQPGDPEWKKLHGPTSYIPDSVLKGHQALTEKYIAAMSALSLELLHLTAKSLGLPPTEFDEFLGKMDRLKIIRYPGPTEDGPPDHNTQQGVGAHKDSSGVFTYVLQDNVGGLQVLDKEGDWIDATPLPGSFVVNIAQGFEALTGGRCLATTHRVRAPPTGVTRYSIAFFEGVRLTLTLDEIAEEVKLISGRIAEANSDTKRRAKATASEFLDPKYDCFGAAHLRNRIISHRDVSEIWYPGLKAKYVAEL